jgi:hypothetical protein
MKTNTAKLFALMIVGGVAKALFTEPRPIIRNEYPTVDKVEPTSPASTSQAIKI